MSEVDRTTLALNARRLAMENQRQTQSQPAQPVSEPEIADPGAAPAGTPLPTLGGWTQQMQDFLSQVPASDTLDPDDQVTPPTRPDHQTPIDPPDPVTPGTDDIYSRVPPQQIDGQPIDVAGGRVTTLALEDHDQVASVRMLDDLERGHVSINPDHSLAVVLSGTDAGGTDSFSYEVTYQDGRVETQTQTLKIAAPTEARGWGQGDHYMLATDQDGHAIVETGENHRKVFISDSDDALSLKDIAAREGLSVSEISKDWLVAHPEYGGSEGLALKPDVGMMVWYNITGPRSEPSSHWLLLERGYDYDLGRLINPATQGEDELHPVHITSWGDGDLPVLDSKIHIYQTPSSNIVFSDIQVDGGVLALDASNLLFDNVHFTKKGTAFQEGSGLTIINSEFVDIARDAPSSASGQWHPHVDRTGGIYASDMQGVLMEGNLFDLNGWKPGYQTDSGSQPPSMYSQNVYMQPTVSDLTFRDNITMRASSFGAQFRGGVYAEDNLFLDNNAAVNFLGGDYDGAGFIGDFTLFADNLITSGAHKSAAQIGALARGVENAGLDSTMLDNIVAHLADPNNAQEFAQKLWDSGGLIHRETPFYDDTILYNWVGSRYVGIDELWNDGANGLSAAELNEITIQKFTADLLDDPAATIADLADYLRAAALADGPDGLTAKDIVAFFQEGFGITPDLRGQATDHRFIPDDLGDGTRWDNRINWSTEDVPTDGDTVDLGGNWVEFAGTVAVKSLDLGENGKVNVDQGRLAVAGTLSVGAAGGEIGVTRAGQFWFDGYADSDELIFNMDGGRLANTGHVSGDVDLTVSDGQAILATGGGVFDLVADAHLAIMGSAAQIGFDGTQGRMAALRLQSDAQLGFTADAGGVSTIGEFRSGAYGTQLSDVRSGVALDGTLTVDVSAMTARNASLTLISVDELTGDFDDIRITGLGTGRNAELSVDYDQDSVVLTLAGGNGRISHRTTGTEQVADSDLADILAGTAHAAPISDDWTL